MTAAVVSIPLGSTPASATALAGTCYDINLHTTGKVHAFTGLDCRTGDLGADVGNDSDWGASGGGFSGGDTNAAYSVLNNGYDEGKSVVALYDYTAYSWDWGYACLKTGDWAPDLSKFSFSPRIYEQNKRYNMGGAISSHQWVYESACAPEYIIAD
ncbi:hypothetical protein AB0J71_47815 [Nonomuraea sp. NPDC049637]|uniref:hypothetical protein n=1 Tax=Nonomuraea sp. NPDC049637 TaxID=3154356 RepID=UPI0034413005